ncbi:hypothetical protein EPD60_03705 [Flaviaesturariibacter flavus]|uniref:LiaF transmembrane domain-containing protein n=1 Tax=Flaviaesturariibacter flavus TaxID=2502780 RepID=A0A4R1BMP8_9BACT|nr:DUF5668 domain-containing protein [Flaviaesturariibacter flavus]TCJ18617.1 hypothetical protein EPD60_03705 [Flaviaesturariibacter flavus]
MDNTDWQRRAEERRVRFEEKMGRMEERWERRRARMHNGRGRVWTGMFLLIVGGLLLARQAGAPLPSWLFTWPVLLIGIGLWIGVRHRFRGFGWAIPLLIGAVYLFDIIDDTVNLRPYAGPLVLILLGLFFIFRSRRRHRPDGDDPMNATNLPATTPGDHPGTTTDLPADRSDRLDVTAVFGGIKKNMISKTFRGGEIVTFMGGAEINLAQADFEGRVLIDCTNVFGGTKLILPPDWEVQSELVAVFGGVDDKRPPAVNPAPNKIVVLDGTCVFGGVEIRSYY